MLFKKYAGRHNVVHLAAIAKIIKAYCLWFHVANTPYIVMYPVCGVKQKHGNHIQMCLHTGEVL